MYCRLSLIALLGMAATAAAKNHTTKVHPTKDNQLNKRKVKGFDMCDNGLYTWTPGNSAGEERPGAYGMYWTGSFGPCVGEDVGDTVAYMSAECSPTRTYVNFTVGGFGQSAFDLDRLPPLLQCSQTFMFTAASSKSGKASGKSEEFGDIYNTVKHDFVLTAPTDSATKTTYLQCLASWYSSSIQKFYVPGVYGCILGAFGVVTADVVARGTDFGKNRMVDVDYDNLDDVWSFKYKGLGWNPFATANKK